MEHGADESVRDQLHTELNIRTAMEEVAPSAAFIEIEIDFNRVKQEPGAEEFVKSEPALIVKEEIQEDSMQDSSSQQVHVSEESKHQGYKCNKCQKVYKSKKILVLHNTRNHGTESHKCIQCKKEFKCKLYLIRHVQDTHSTKQYKCDICKKMCKSQRALYRHVSSVHRDRFADSSSKPGHGREEKKHQEYRCNKCPNVFKSKVYLNQHNSTVHGTESHKCIQCDKEFKCKEYLSRHVQDIHSKEQYECDICKKMCKSRGALHNHVSYFHRRRFVEPDAIYPCDKCMKIFKSKGAIKNHCKNAHETGQYNCVQCNREYKSIRYLKNHINSVHTNKQYECDICKKICKSKKSLSRHIRLACHRLPALDKLQGNPGATTVSSVSSFNVATCGADQADGLYIKQESDDADLDIGPTVLQHMDSHYTFNQVKTEHVKMESPPLTDEQTVKNEPGLSVQGDIGV